MPPKGAMSQQRLFYNKDWTKSIEKRFIANLVYHREQGKLQPGRDLKVVLNSAISDVNTQFGTCIGYGVAKERYKKLHKRYKVFSWVLSVEGVKYNPVTNKTKAQQYIWDFICKEERLGAAYMEIGDPDFKELEKIFSDKPIVDQKATDIINISSSGSEDGIASLASVKDYVSDSVPTNTSADTETCWWTETAWYLSDEGSSEASASAEFPPPQGSSSCGEGVDLLRNFMQGGAPHLPSNKSSNASTPAP